MKRRTMLFIISLILLLITVKFILLRPEDESTTKNSIPKNPTVNVTGYVASARMLENKLFSYGTILSNEQVELRPEVSGKLVSIHFQEGSFVKKGTMLAKINDIDLQAQLKKSSLAWKLAKERKDRLKGMLDIQGVSQEEYDAAANQVQTFATDMDYINAQIAKTEIHAPFSGHIGLRQVSEGSFVTSNTVIATIQQTDQLKIDFTVPEKYASLVSKGDFIHFNVGNLQEQFTARVYAIEPNIDQLTRNIAIRALFKNTTSAVFPGSFARIELVANKKEAALMIPTEAVIPDLKGKKVFIAKDGKAHSVKIETGLRNDAQIEIISGLAEGDTVITTGIMTLKPDTKVKFISINK